MQDEATLWRRWRDHADAVARVALGERYTKFARAVAAKLYARRPHEGVEFDEYQQFAMVGLMESIDRYLPDRGARFSTFALRRIQGAILNGLERISEREQQRAFYRRCGVDRAGSLKPERLSLDSTELLQQLEEISVGVALGLVLEGAGVPLAPGQALPGNAYQQLELREMHERLWGMVDSLPARERELVKLHYRSGAPFEDVARALQVSKGRVSQLHRQAVERLRGLLAAGTCDVMY